MWNTTVTAQACKHVLNLSTLKHTVYISGSNAEVGYAHYNRAQTSETRGI